MTGALDRSRIRAVCFDLDGTLADTDDAYIASLAALLSRLPSALRGPSPERAARRWIMAAETPVNSLMAAADLLGVDEPLGRFSDWLRGWPGRPRRSRLRLIPGVPQMLDRLAARFPFALVSARDAHTTSALLADLGLEKYFGHVATARTVRRSKPHPAPILWAAERMGLPPEACLVVGDTTVDIRAGRAAGAQTAGVLCGFGERAELERAGANLVLEATPELEGVLLGE